jgi:formamidopyrimidine-DNA glycosylase
MPEIAEVERARAILEQILKGQNIVDVESVLFGVFCILT